KITPTTIQKNIDYVLTSVYESDYVTVPTVAEPIPSYASPEEVVSLIKSLEAEMKKAAEELAFEKAAEIRDRIKQLKEKVLEVPVA
nr:excinuclease ABC subunit B [Desulfobacterales bacterium]